MIFVTLIMPSMWMIRNSHLDEYIYHRGRSCFLEYGVLWGNMSCNIVAEFHFNIGNYGFHFKALKLNYDNSSIVSFFLNTRSTFYSKYIYIKFYFVKEKVVESLINIEHMLTSNMLTNPLTTSLPICMFRNIFPA